MSCDDKPLCYLAVNVQSGVVVLVGSWWWSYVAVDLCHCAV